MTIPVLLDPVTHLVHLAESLQASPAPSRRLIGLAGLPGSGKSTLASRLAEAVNDRCGCQTMVALSMDGFHFSRQILASWPNASAAFARRGAAWTFDVVSLKQRLQQLHQNRGGVEWPDFDHTVGDPFEPAHRVPVSTRVVLVEGLYLLGQSEGWQEVSELFDERWYLDTPLDLSLQRLKKRHMTVWEWTEQEAQERIDYNDIHNARIVEMSRASADWLLPAS